MPAVTAGIHLWDEPQHLETAYLTHDADVEQAVVDDRVRDDPHAASVAGAVTDSDQEHGLLQFALVQGDTHARRVGVPQGLHDAQHIRHRSADNLGHGIDAPGDLR